MSEVTLTELRRSLGVMCRSDRYFYFFTEAVAQADQLARGLAALFPASAHLYRLAGDHVTPDEGPEILAALQRGTWSNLI